MKGVSTVISYVLIFMVAITLTGAAYMYVLPKFSDMKAKSEFEYMLVYMKKLDDKIRSVSHSGEGTKDYASINMQLGTLQIFAVNDKIMYIVPSTICLEKRNVTGLYIETDIGAVCSNKIIMNYTAIDIINNATRNGFFSLSVENVGYTTKPLIRVE
jgi:hypothetical protein